uniref:SET domain-containing protein n=1 Tax=Steinernema glaseri TaxID=37863 RepID=A0A1I8ALB9_9BILA
MLYQTAVGSSSLGTNFKDKHFIQMRTSKKGVKMLSGQILRECPYCHKDYEQIAVHLKRTKLHPYNPELRDTDYMAAVLQAIYNDLPLPPVPVHLKVLKSVQGALPPISPRPSTDEEFTGSLDVNEQLLDFFTELHEMALDKKFSMSNKGRRLFRATFSGRYKHDADSCVPEFLKKLYTKSLLLRKTKASALAHANRANCVIYYLMDGKQPGKSMLTDVLKRIDMLVPMCRSYLRSTHNFGNLARYMRSFGDYIEAETSFCVSEEGKGRLSKSCKRLQVAQETVSTIVCLLDKKEAKAQSARPERKDARTYAELLAPLRSEAVKKKLRKVERHVRKNEADEEDYLFLMNYVITAMIFRNGGRSEIVYKMTNANLTQACEHEVNARNVDSKAEDKVHKVLVLMVGGTKTGRDAGIALSIDDAHWLQLYVQLRDTLYAEVEDLTAPESRLFLSTKKRPIGHDVHKRLHSVERVAGVPHDQLYSTMSVRRACATKSLLLYFNTLAALEEGHINWGQLAANHNASTRLRVYARKGFGQMVATFYVLLQLVEKRNEAVHSAYNERNWTVVFKTQVPKNLHCRRLFDKNAGAFNGHEEPEIPALHVPGTKVLSQDWKDFQSKIYPISLDGWDWDPQYYELLLPDGLASTEEEKHAVYAYMHTQYLKMALKELATKNPFRKDRLHKLRRDPKKGTSQHHEKMEKWFNERLSEEHSTTAPWNLILAAVRHEREAHVAKKELIQQQQGPATENPVEVVLAVTADDINDLECLPSEAVEAAFSPEAEEQELATENPEDPTPARSDVIENPESPKPASTRNFSRMSTRSRARVEAVNRQDVPPKNAPEAIERFKCVKKKKHGELVQDIPWIKRKTVNDQIGQGVYARADIPLATYVLDYPATGGVIDKRTYETKYSTGQLDPNKEAEFHIVSSYALELSRPHNVVLLGHNPTDDKGVAVYGRSVNHSKCKQCANLMPTLHGKGKEAIVLFRSNRNIKKGEQLLWDYGDLAGGEDGKSCKDWICPCLSEKFPSTCSKCIKGRKK